MKSRILIVIAGKVEIRRQTIMNEGALVGRQDAEGRESLSPSPGMDAIPGDQFCTDNVKPVELRIHQHGPQALVVCG